MYEVEDKAPGSDIAPGDVVVLRSGGPRMTVESTTAGGTMIDTGWFTKAGDIQTGTFPSDMLQRA